MTDKSREERLNDIETNRQLLCDDQGFLDNFSNKSVMWLISELKSAWQREEKLREKIDYHRKAYATEIIPDYNLKDNPNPSIDQVAGKMGRHMCDMFLKYLNEADHAPRAENE